MARLLIGIVFLMVASLAENFEKKFFDFTAYHWMHVVPFKMAALKSSRVPNVCSIFSTYPTVQNVETNYEYSVFIVTEAEWDETATKREKETALVYSIQNIVIDHALCFNDILFTP